MRSRLRTGIIIGAAVALIGAKDGEAASLRTPRIAPGSGEKLVCTVVNIREKGLTLRAEIVDRFGNNATDFSRTDWNADETIVTVLRVESGNPNARYCRISVTGGRKSDVAGTLQACSWDDTACGRPVPAH